MRHRYFTADVFTDRIFGGNPLAVFPDARAIPESRLQQIAGEFNLSETVFVFPPQDPAHTRRVRIFTPRRELAFAGHPTVGCAFVLASIGEVGHSGPETRIVLEEGVGPVPVVIRTVDGKPVAAELTAAQPVSFGPGAPAEADLAAVLSLTPGEVTAGAVIASTGTPFLFVPLRDRAAVARARIDPGAWDRVCGALPVEGVFLFSFDPERAGSHVRARMFAPGHGIAEDPATGSACAALGGYLAARVTIEAATLRWVVEQGFEMGRPSIIEVQVDRPSGAIRVGGCSVLVSEGMMEVPA